MIQISHKQAQHLIREAQDRRLPEEQWAILYAHLEDCADCRAYRQRLTAYDKDLRRSLHTRWCAVRGPQEGIAGFIIEARTRKAHLAKTFRRTGLYGLGLLLLIGYIAFRQITEPP